MAVGNYFRMLPAMWRALWLWRKGQNGFDSRPEPIVSVWPDFSSTCSRSMVLVPWHQSGENRQKGWQLGETGTFFFGQRI